MAPIDEAAMDRALRAAMVSPEAETDFDRFQTRLFAKDDTVRSGPFRGMRLVAERSPFITHYLLGAYERELHPALERLLAGGYDTVVDVGCAEGYYAVGLARRLPSARVYAFDIDQTAQQVCVRLAVANDVADRVVVGGVCEPDQLERLITKRSMVFVDCEGCEAHLLDPSLVPAVMGADLIIELHDFIDPTITGAILGRFTSTHDIELIEATPSAAEDFPELDQESGAVKFSALWEGRPLEPHPMQWAVMTTRRP